MAESFVERRKRELGLTPSTPSSTTQVHTSPPKPVEKPKESDFVTKRKIELGLAPDPKIAVGQKQAASFKQAEQKFGHNSANPADSKVMQIANKYADDNPTWGGIIDNPIGRGAGKVLGAIGTGIENVKDATGLSNVQGAVRGLSTAEYPTHTSDGTYLGEYKTLAQNAVEGVSNIAKSTVQGFLHPKEADKKFGALVDQGLKNTNPVTRFAGKMVAEGATDPTSYIPIPVSQIVKGFKELPSTVSTAFDRFASRNNPIADFAPEVSPTLALPSASEESLKAFNARSQNMQAYYMKNLPEVNVLPANKTPIRGQGNVPKPETLGLPESAQYNAIQRIKAQQTLNLPEASPKTISELNRRNGNIQPTNTNPIYGQGSVADPLGLPQGDYIKPTRLRVSNANETLDHVITKIRPEVISIIEAPARRDLLVTYVQKNTGFPIEEIHNMPIKDLQDYGQMIQNKLQENMEQIAYDVATKHGYDLPSLFKGKAPSVSGQIAKDAQSRIYGVPVEKVNTPRPKFNKEVTGQAAAPKQGLAFKREPKSSESIPFVETSLQKQQRIAKQIKAAEDKKKISELSRPIIGRAAMPETKIGRAPTLREATTKSKVEPLNRTVIKKETVQPRITTVLPDEKIKGQQLKDLRTGDETGFAHTVKNSEYTAPDLKKTITEEPITGARTTDVLNRQEANKMIEKQGREVLYSSLIAKKKQFNATETTAAQILAKHYSSLGGKENLSKAIELVSKTAKGGREMGQAIQALSQWDKLDSEGALLIGTRQLNKGEENINLWKKLTPEQGAPITEAAQRIGKAQDTKNLADEVLSIVTNKADGVALTEVEKATIKQFQDQVKLINEKGKGILSKPRAEKVVNKSDETIKEVSQIEPKARTRDQVVSFLDAKADKARKRLAASRNLGFAASADKGNPVIDYAIIGASHIAKGVVKLSDFTEAMVKDFGDSVKPHINEAFNRATNIFRKENGLPTVEQLDKVVNAAVKSEHFTPEQANQFKAWASEIGHYADKNLKVEATQDLQRALNDIGTSTLGDKLSATQTATQLLSVPTLVRNVVGNEAFNLVEKINKIAAAPIDWGLSKFTGERTVVFSAKNQEKYWNNFIKGLKGGWKGISPNGQFEAYDIHPSAFKSDKNPLKYLQKALGAELQSFDHAAYMRAYGRTLGEYAKITGKKVEDLDQKIFELADEAGRYATFQDDTFLSKLATGTKRLLNKPTDLLADALVHKGVLPESLSWKGFGTGDLILKYAKTPANIVMRGIDYSPIGIMRGLGELIPLITGKTFNQRAATMALSRGITGSLGMTAMGYALISTGILTGKSSDDADIRSLDLQSGKGEYKVNWDALSRYVKGGLDKDAAQWKKGDNITDWGWLQPMAISISMGVNAQQSVEKQKTEGVKSYVGVAKDALLGSLKTIMQQPLLSGVQNLVSGVTNVMRYGSWTGIANIFKGLPASFVPSAANQARNFTDNTTRNTYDPSALKEALNMVINKIPGLDKKLPIAYDALGGKREQIQGGQDKTKVQGAKTFLSPVKLTKYQVSPEAKMIMDLINETGNETVAPRTPKKYLMVNKKKIELTPEQYSDLQKNTGEATQKALAKISGYLSSDVHTEDQKVKKVVDTLNDVGDSVRKQLNKEYPELKPKTAQQLRRESMLRGK